MNIELPELTTWQQGAISRATARNIVNAGRQSGKSTLIVELMYEAICKGLKVALVFPTYKALWQHWTKIANTFYPAITDKNLSRMTIDFAGNCSLECFSAENYDVIRGNQFDLCIVDEAAWCGKLQDMIESVIYPTLLAREGVLWLLSTPKGTQGYFNQCLTSGLYTVTRATSYDNPHLSKDAIDALRLSMSPEKVQQELLGIPVDETALTPFFYAYVPEVHFTPGRSREPRQCLWFSFDFNVSIMSCVIAQETTDHVLQVLDLIQLKNSSVQAMAERLQQLYPHEISIGNYKLTGDASGNNRSGYLEGNISYYKVIKNILHYRDYNYRVPTHNLGHGQSQQLVNAIIQHGLVTVSSPELNRQMKALTIADEGIVKDGIIDHGTDCLRYMLHALYFDFLTKPFKYVRSGLPKEIV
jgi:hypothetical protein